MSRVQWRGLVQRESFEFAKGGGSMRTAAGWAVCGSLDFVQGVVPAMRTAGLSVVALSVLPTHFHNVPARLRAQGARPHLAPLRIPTHLTHLFLVALASQMCRTRSAVH